jgi:putative phosphoribosyl transferase
MGFLFRDRLDAGNNLAPRLAPTYAGRRDVVVLALPRGGVPVAFPIATALDAPLDVFVVRKLGVPGHEELAMGALARGGVRVLNESVIQALGIPKAAIEAAAQREALEIERRERDYRGERPYPAVEDRIVILVDDGLATGSSMRAAVRALRQSRPREIVVAVPVGSPETCAELRDEVDEVICGETPRDFSAVGEWYRDFRQTTDEEVRDLLRRAASRPTREPLAHSER